MNEYFAMDYVFPLYGLMLVQPIVEFCGMLFAMIVYRIKQEKRVKKTDFLKARTESGSGEIMPG